MIRPGDQRPTHSELFSTEPWNAPGQRLGIAIYANLGGQHTRVLMRAEACKVAEDFAISFSRTGSLRVWFSGPTANTLKHTLIFHLEPDMWREVYLYVGLGKDRICYEINRSLDFPGAD